MLVIRNKKKISALIFIILMGVTILAFKNPKYHKENNLKIDLINNRNIILKDAGTWEISPLIIGGNGGWAILASTYAWCSGNGTWSNPYLIENVTIKGQETSDYCMEIISSNVYFKIINCRFYNSSQSMHGAIHVENVENGFFLYNNFSLNWRGLYLENSNNITIKGNNFNDDITKEIAESFNLQDCIRLDLCENNTILENKIQKTSAGIRLYKSYKNKINNNKIMETGSSIWSHQSNENNISGNKIEYNSGHGIELINSDFTIISNNIVENNDLGITLSECLNVSILRNNINNNLYTGLGQHDSNYTLIQGNNITHSDWGIYYDSNHNNTIKENIINYNRFGISTWYCNNNKIQGNIIFHNDNRGLTLEGDNNTIFLNNFSYNGNNVESYGFNNKWDNGTIGNYYSDYTGKDANDDGIGDTIHIIGDSSDNFPIWWDPPVINIYQPIINQLFGNRPPNFNISIDEGFADKIWYSINDGIRIFIDELNGIIDQGIWNSTDYGIITITFYANDSLGTVGFKEITIRKDITAPIITINNPQDSDVIGATAPNFDIYIQELNLDKTWYSLNGGTNITFTGLTGSINQALWSTLPDGNIIIRFYANDSAENIGFNEVTIRKDVTAPIITINNPQDSDVIGATAPNFDIYIEELNLDKTWYSLNGGTNITFTGLTGSINQALWSALPDGNIIIRFYANDSAGNIGFQEINVVKRISQTFPPGIPGYNILLLLGIVSTIVVIIVKKRLIFPSKIY